MPITMYNKKTEQNVKVYGFVQANAYGFVQADVGVYSGNGRTYAVTYQLANLDAQLAKLKAIANNSSYEANADDLELVLVPAVDLRPLDV